MKMYIKIIIISSLLIGCTNVQKNIVMHESRPVQPINEIQNMLKINPILYYKFAKEKIELIKQRKFSDIEIEINSLSKDLSSNSASINFFYKTLSKKTDSLPLLNEWCEKYPDSYIAFTARGYFYVEYAWRARTGKWAKDVPKDAWPIFFERLKLAKSDFEKAYELNPHDPCSSSGLILIARGLSLNKDYMEKQFQNAVNIDKYNFEAHYQKFIYLAPKWYGSDEEMFSFARQTANMSPLGSYLKMLIVNAHEEKALLIGWNDEKDKFNAQHKANYLQNNIVWQEIESIFSECIKAQSENIMLYLKYADIANSAKKYDLRQENFEKAKSIAILNDVSFAEFLTQYDYCESYNYADYLYDSKNYREAIDFLNEAIKVKDDYCYFYNLLAYSYYMLNKYEESSVNIKKSLSLNSDQNIILSFDYKIQGTVLHKKGNYFEAIKNYEKAITFNDKDVHLYNMIADCYSYIGDREKTKEFFEKSLIINPKQKKIKKKLDGILDWEKKNVK